MLSSVAFLLLNFIILSFSTVITAIFYHEIRVQLSVLDNAFDSWMI